MQVTQDPDWGQKSLKLTTEHCVDTTFSLSNLRKMEDVASSQTLSIDTPLSVTQELAIVQVKWYLME